LTHQQQPRGQAEADNEAESIKPYFERFLGLC
jgi:hypothetical protein